MNTMVDNIFTDQGAEYLNLQSSSPSIDLTDWQCAGTPTSGTCGTLTSSSSFLVTDPLAQVGYYEIEFMLDNQYWNCGFSFGNSACGIQVRQGIAHMFDKNSYCINSVVAGTCTPIDNPLPTTSIGGLPSPNPCGYDTSFLQSGSNCIVGSPGGTAYHLAPSGAGADGFAWLYAPGSVDLNASARHFVNAGVATGFGKTTSFFIRNDDEPRRTLGESLSAQICYVFTGLYTQPCVPFLNTVEGPITAFPGFTTTPTSVNQDWWMYTAAFSGPTFVDGLYFGYNSHFASASCLSPGTVSCTTQQIGGGFCSNASVGTASAANYEYACVPSFDSLSYRMETAPCLTATGDPAVGQPNNGPGANCSGTSQLSAISAGVQAEAAFGADALTIPNFELTTQYGYLNNGWVRADNSVVAGLPNYFTWLNAWNPAPVQSGTIRQGFKETTRSVSPYIASTVWDFYIDGLVYDTLLAANPLSPGQLIDWMTYSAIQQSNATVISSSGYTPPAHTLSTYHFTLRNDLFFQDGRPVTAYDVAFSYLSLIGTGAFQSASASIMTGITVLGPRSFDIGVSSLGPFTLPDLTGLTILSGRYWTCASSTNPCPTNASFYWDSAIAQCTRSPPCSQLQWIINPTSPTNPIMTCAKLIGGCGCTLPTSLLICTTPIMNVDPSKITATYDPIANHVLVGSGPWECAVTGSGSGLCSSSVFQNPPAGGSYTLTRFGKGLAPGSSTTGTYFRSSGNLALYDWTGESDTSAVQPVSAVSLCFNAPVLTGSCTHWQQGIGASSTGIVGINQISTVELRYNLNWVAPFEWATNPPLGIGALAPILYEGSVTLNPCSIQPSQPPCRKKSNTAYPHSLAAL